MKVALIHDHLAQDGGAEKVLKVLSEMFPQADIYTLLYEKANADKYFKDKKINTSIIQRIPLGVRFYKWYLPIMPLAVEFFDLTKYDLVVSDTSSFAKGVITTTDTLHISYCHTPTRYLWSDTHSYIKELKYNKYFKKLIAMSLKKIRVWDRVAADRPDYFVANSSFIKKRIKKYYRRDSEVIYPPVDLSKFYIAEKQDYFLAGGRLVPYKRFDLAIEAFKQSGLPLKIFGSGPDTDRLKKMAEGHDNIEFLGRVSEKQKCELYARAKAFINPQEEDFGITMVEALASGTPVIAYAAGGALEIVKPECGLCFAKQTKESLKQAVNEFAGKNFDAQAVRQSSERFSADRFKREMMDFIKQKMEAMKQ